MITEQMPAISLPAPVPISLPAVMEGLEWTQLPPESALSRKPKVSTYSLTPRHLESRLLFNETDVFVVDPKTGYDQLENRWWRTDIYTAVITPAVKEWIVEQMPDWWDWAYAASVLNQPVEQIGHGRAGRFTQRDYVTDTEWSMLHMARVWHFPPGEIAWEPEPRLVWTIASRESAAARSACGRTG